MLWIWNRQTAGPARNGGINGGPLFYVFKRCNNRQALFQGAVSHPQGTARREGNAAKDPSMRILAYCLIPKYWQVSLVVPSTN